MKFVAGNADSFKMILNLAQPGNEVGYSKANFMPRFEISY
jgi:hypothetical protein